MLVSARAYFFIKLKGNVKLWRDTKFSCAFDMSKKFIKKHKISIIDRWGYNFIIIMPLRLVE
jgi:hypothetical protein